MRLSLSLICATATAVACTTVDELRQQPILWTAIYPARFDVLANCLAVRMAQDFDVTPQFYLPERRAVLTAASKGGGRMSAEYSVRQISDVDSEVTFRRQPSAFNNESLTNEARALADRCASAERR